MKYLIAVSLLWPVLMVVGGLMLYTVFWLALRASDLFLKLLL